MKHASVLVPGGGARPCALACITPGLLRRTALALTGALALDNGPSPLTCAELCGTKATLACALCAEGLALGPL